MEVRYSIDGVDLKEAYNLRVSQSKGLLDFPGFKETISGDWPEINGKIVDLTARALKEREIILDCSIVADDSLTLGTTISDFFKTLQTDGLKLLKVTVDTPQEYPLFYMIYLYSGIVVNKRWKDGKIAGFFQLKFLEPEPQKRVFKHVSIKPEDTDADAYFRISSNYPFNLYFGDGSFLKDNKGDDLVFQHNYPLGTYYIIITGMISDIRIDESRNVTDVWLIL